MLASARRAVDDGDRKAQDQERRSGGDEVSGRIRAEDAGADLDGGIAGANSARGSDSCCEKDDKRNEREGPGSHARLRRCRHQGGVGARGCEQRGYENAEILGTLSV